MPNRANPLTLAKFIPTPWTEPANQSRVFVSAIIALTRFARLDARIPALLNDRLKPAGGLFVSVVRFIGHFRALSLVLTNDWLMLVKSDTLML